MSEHSTLGEQALELRGEAPHRRKVLEDLLCWGRLLEQVLTSISPLYLLEDLLLDNHPAVDPTDPLAGLVVSFGYGTAGQPFLSWWIGVGDAAPGSSEVALALAEESALSRRDNEADLAALEGIAERAFLRFTRDWVLDRDRLRPRQGGLGVASDVRLTLDNEMWERVEERLRSAPREEAFSEPLSASLDHAIARVRSFFEPLESPLFGMNTELLAHHVRETIPREVPGDTMTPIVPLFGKHKRNQSFSSVVALPTHLRVILRRLETSQAQNEVVTALLATLEAVDFGLRFMTGLAQGCWSAVADTELPGPFDPTTAQLISDLGRTTRHLRSYWDHSHAQPALHLLFRGKDLHPFLVWAGLETAPRLLAWMMDAEEAIREDNPARCSALAEEMTEEFHSWLAELVLLCSAWDVVVAPRQDGYLGISVSRGAVGVVCKPLVDPTRYSVWLDRSEIAAVNEQFEPGRAGGGGLPPLDARIMLQSNDPPLLSEHISALLKAHEQGQVLPLGRSLFHGLEYLVRLHASLAGGYLLHRFEESSFLDPVLKPGGALQHSVFFLAYAQRILAEIDDPAARLLRSVFFPAPGQPRSFTRWLGVDGGVPGPLQGLLGWSVSLLRPDAAHRLDEIRGQISQFSGIFAEFVEASRSLWAAARLGTEPGAEGAQATVCQFPSGLRIRGVPDIVVGHRLEAVPTGVVIGGAPLVGGPFAHWEGEDAPSVELPPVALNVPREESSWPSFFEDPQEIAEVSWSSELARELEHRCRDASFSGPEGRPLQLAQEIATFMQSAGPGRSTISLIRGDRGSGRTLLCRTLVHPEHSPLGEDFPVLYLKVDRFPETRLSTVVERLNDHIASESSLDRFGWVPVPNGTLQSLGNEVDRLGRDLADLGLRTPPLACRLSSYLRCLKKINGGREFLLVLDGFETVPPAIVPKILSPGIHLLITGTEFPRHDERTPYVLHQHLDLSQERSARSNFDAQLGESAGVASEERIIFQRFGGSLLKARAYLNLRDNTESYTPNPAVLEDLLAFGRRLFPESTRREGFLQLLCTLGLYERPVPLRILESLGIDVEVANVATNSLPALFSFWAEPEPSLGLAHREIFDLLIGTTGLVEAVAAKLARDFLAAPRRSDLMPALRWFSFSGAQAELIEPFFANTEVVNVWREELARLWRDGLYFQRVALLDATEEPLLAAIEAGAGHLREELGWLHNARGLSLLKLGLLEDASADLQIALERFQAQFAAGEMGMISSIGSATNRLSEVALKGGDLGRAASLSEMALEVLEEGRAFADTAQLRALTAIALVQWAQIKLREGAFAQALEATESANELLSELDSARFAGLLGEAGWYRAEALAGLGKTDLAIRELAMTVEQLFKSSGSVESGLQALLLRARLQKRAGDLEAAYGDLDRAVSILRYRVFRGRLDLEPLLAYTTARRALTGGGSADEEAHALGEFVEWARAAIRFEGRGDLRALLAYVYLARGQCWKDAGAFAKALEDLRSATEQYDLLGSEILGSSSAASGRSRDGGGAVWNGLRAAFMQMTALYVSLDEAPLAILSGRRALELGQRATSENLSFESGLEVPEFSLVAPSNGAAIGDPFEGELYQAAKLYFHLGEATRRLNLDRFAAAYFEQAALGFERLFAEHDQAPSDKLEEYRVVLKYVARSADARRDFDGLSHWALKLRGLPESVLTPFDRFSVHGFLGKSRVFRGDLEGALDEYRSGLDALELLSNHPRFGSLRADTLLELGRIYSLQGQHGRALEHLEQAAQAGQDVVFEEGEENRELLVRGALHLAVAHLRAGHRDEALDQLRILVSFRPLGGIAELEQLTDDWVTAWQDAEPLTVAELVLRLSQMCELGDWLLRTPLGLWFRELVTELVTHSGFSSLIWDSERLDQVIETFLVVAFSQSGADNPSLGHRGTSVSDTGELSRLLKAKYRALESEGRLVEAELALSHMLPSRTTPTSGRILLKRSEMALRRGDRGVGIVDLLRATESRGRAKVHAHLRLAEFLLSRDLQAATALHLRRSLFSVDDAFSDLPQLLERVGSLMTGLVRTGAQLEPDVLEEYLRVCRRPLLGRAALVLEPDWLTALGDYREWPLLIEATLALVSYRQSLSADDANDWRFLEEVLERTLLCAGTLSPLALRDLGELLVEGGMRGPELTGPLREAVWQRFVNLLPLLGRRDGFALMRRLFEGASGKGEARAEGRAAEFLARLEEEMRLLSQPG